MSKVLVNDIVETLGLKYGEFFAVKGHTHEGGIRNGTEFNMVFLPYKLGKAMWEKDKITAVKVGDTRFLPIAMSDFHAICCGMLKVVRADENERQYVYGYAPDNTFKDEIESTQGTLF